MSNKAIENRPLKFGSNDRRELIVEDGEVSLIAVNDSTGSPIFLGRAKAGTALDAEKWQIRKITYDSNGGVTRVKWAEDSQNKASTDYEFAWSSFTNLTITGITQANPAVVSVASTATLTNGDQIIITGVVGMTQVNFTGTNIYTVANKAAGTFQLSGIDSSAYGAYVSGGSVDASEYINYTYA
jgi:hypothetical protein